MDVVTKFALTVALLVVSMVSGYGARKFRLVPESAAPILMAIVAVFGYGLVALLSLWQTPLRVTHVWLPTLAMLHVVLMLGVGLAVARGLTRERAERGVFGIAGCLGNTGPTMGGFVIYLLYGEAGLGLVSMLGLMWTPVVVLVCYPVARHFGRTGEPVPLGRLILHSVFDWRAAGALAIVAGILLSRFGPPRPAFVSDYRIVDVLVFLITAAAYFSIGLRLHLRHVPAFGRMILALGATRFAVGLGVGILLASLTRLTPDPLHGMARDVFLIESCVPTAVTMVAIANMFHLAPRVGSLLFVSNTLMYLVLVLPWVLWVFGR